MDILSFLWQLPQNMLGIIVLLFNKACKHPIMECVNSDGIKYYVVKHINDCGISLGNYIFLDEDRSISEKSVKHEYGHQLQSKKLGWLYLAIIGIPSIFGNLLDLVFHKSWSAEKRYIWYYNQLWEKWADDLGNVRR